MRAEQVTDPVAYHGEGPVWSDRWGGLRWVDMLAGDVLSLAADGTINRRHVDSVAAAIRPRRVGGVVIIWARLAPRPCLSSWRSGALARRAPIPIRRLGVRA